MGTMRRRDFGIGAAAFGAASLPPMRWAHAQTGAPTRAESLRILSEAGPNSFDPIGLGVNRNSIQAHWNLYDRLVRFGSRREPDGTLYYDYYAIEGELAERFEVSADRRMITFHLRRDATFHDGAPVTAEDVKWSLDRVVSLPVGKSQFATGSLTDANQFEIIDAHTIKVTTPRADRFTLPNLALPFPIILNSRLAKSHATAEDPWATEWLKTNVAGGGPFKLEAYSPGQSLTYSRFDEWKNGEPPGFRRVLWQVVPAAQSRRSALLRGDADIVQDLPPQDVVSMSRSGAVKLVGAPMAGAFQFIGMNNATPPFNDKRVRQAIAYALPYQDMFDAALFKRGKPLFGGKPGAPQSIEFPQPLGYSTDPAKAKALLAEAGLANGFETSFSFEVSNATIGEPVALLVQEALGKLGIKVTINKVPGGQMGALLARKEAPFFFEASSAFLADPDYFFRIFYHGPTRWNFGSYQNPEFMALVEKTRFETDLPAYMTDVRRMIELAKDEVPIILLWQPTLDTGMQKSVEGYKYLFHRMLEFRSLRRV
jgi:peptide/nickel transport system substrate-binding protein